MADEQPENRSDDVRLVGRAVHDDEWVVDFLDRRPMGALSLVDEGSPYVVTQLFVHDADAEAIFFHGAATGRTRRIVEAGDPAEASLAVSEMGRLLPAEMPVDFDVEYASVVVFGEISVVENPERKRAALELLMEKFAPQLSPGTDYEPIADDSIDRTSVYRLDIDGWSGKQNEPGSFPGAYDYETVRDESDR